MLDLLIRKLKVLSGFEGAKIKFENLKSKKKFEAAYQNKTEQALLTKSTKEITSCFSKGIERQKIWDLNSSIMAWNRFLEGLMSAKYDEAEVIALLKNNPQEFFGRGWFYPEAECMSLCILHRRHTGGVLSGTAYKWKTTLPKAFFENADNILLLYAQGAKYWDERVEKLMDSPALNDALIEDAAFKARGFVMKLTFHRDTLFVENHRKIRQLKQDHQEEYDLNKSLHILREIDNCKKEIEKLKEIDVFCSSGIDYLMQQKRLVEEKQKREKTAQK